jgi:hypothetical protein
MKEAEGASASTYFNKKKEKRGKFLHHDGYRSWVFWWIKAVEGYMAGVDPMAMVDHGLK